jgi:hypothetical protein
MRCECAFCFAHALAYPYPLRAALAQDVVVRTYGARRSPFDILAPSAAAALRAAAAVAEERLAFAAYLRPRL